MHLAWFRLISHFRCFYSEFQTLVLTIRQLLCWFWAHFVRLLKSFSELQMEVLLANQCFDSLRHAKFGWLYNLPYFHFVQMLKVPFCVYFQSWQGSFQAFCHRLTQCLNLYNTLQNLSALRKRCKWWPETESFALVLNAWSATLLLWRLRSDWSPALKSYCLWARLYSCIRAVVSSHWPDWVKRQEAIHEVALHLIAFDWPVNCFLGVLHVLHSNWRLAPDLQARYLQTPPSLSMALPYYSLTTGRRFTNQLMDDHAHQVT